MQSLFNLKFEHPIDRALYELMITHAMAAEKLGPGGFNRCIELVQDKLFSSVSTEFERPTARHARMVDINVNAQRYASRGDPRVIAMVPEALKLAGFGGRILIEKSSSVTPSVELVRGYTFDLQQLLPIDVSFVKPRVTCIDGYVENVSEIHHLLEAASSAKEPCVLFLRGMSEDVKHTLKVNYDRGSLRVIPLGVRFDLEGMNSLVDISIATGCDLISSLKGDLISSIKFEELPCVSQITVFKGRVVITESSTRRAVGGHVATLRKRRATENVEDVGHLLDKRIKSLSPNHVIIRLPDDKDFVTNSQSIDYALRAVRSIVDYGVTSDGLPVVTEVAAQVHSDRCVKTLRELGAYLSSDLGG